MIVYGLEETAEKYVLARIQTVLSDIDEKPAISDCH